jgi:hypothetical protein
MTEIAGSDGPFLIGGGGYDNLCAYRLAIQDDAVSLEPYDMRYGYKMMVGTNLVFCVFFGVMLYFSTFVKNPPWVFGVIVGIWAATSVGFDLFVYYRFRNAIKRGVIFRYHRKSKLIELPNHGIEFKADDSVHIECLTAKLSATDFGDPNSELNFVSNSATGTNRWNLLRSIATIRPFGSITSQLARELPIEVRRV